MDSTTKSIFLDALASVFRKTLASKLREVQNYCASQKPSRRVSDEVLCTLYPRANDCTQYSASVITNSTLGDISGRYTFYTSPSFPDEETALNHLTHQVSLAALKNPHITFLRQAEDTCRFSAGDWASITNNSSSKINFMTKVHSASKGSRLRTQLSIRVYVASTTWQLVKFRFTN